MGQARRKIRVFGKVQGVGFRPFAHNAASSNYLSGYVENSGAFVYIEVEGSAENIERFLETIKTGTPEPGHITSITTEDMPVSGSAGFFIRASAQGEYGSAFPSADIPVCDDCLREMNDPVNRRYGYAMIGCSACGPRFTITSSLPYDRHVTSMVDFEMCEDCRKEYEDPADRRFHSQLNCCEKCGPDVIFKCADGKSYAPGGESVAAAVKLIRDGKILAVKGLGGYHLACDATSEDAVIRLRKRKRRDEKPFAVMTADIKAALSACEINDNEKSLLEGPEKPVVLLRTKKTTPVTKSVAPGNCFTGLMLPYAPIHHLLLKEVVPFLVMTSGNMSGEPIICDDSQAIAEMSDVADGFLANNRAIRTRCDDSVVREWRGKKYYIRRSRGSAPLPVSIENNFDKTVLACGGELKNTFCLGIGKNAYLSQHIGDLEGGDTITSYEDSIENFCELVGARFQMVACDMHPEYLSTKYARKTRNKNQVVEVQHHHAHIASCLAENGWTGGPVTGVAFDGLGYGLDGTLWGGEFLVADYGGFRRAAHLRNVSMPGGAAAIHEPWRMAIAWAVASSCGNAEAMLRKRVGDERVDIIKAMISAKTNAPETSGMGRLFDAVASLVLMRDKVRYEGQAAMELEQAALHVSADSIYEYRLIQENTEALFWGECQNLSPEASSLIIDPSPTIIGIVEDIERGVGSPEIAAKFHMTIVDMIQQVCMGIKKACGISTVALSGGVFQNMLILEGAVSALERSGFAVLTHREVPCNDGGLSLGQAVVANQLMNRS